MRKKNGTILEKFGPHCSSSNFFLRLLNDFGGEKIIAFEQFSRFEERRVSLRNQPTFPPYNGDFLLQFVTRTAEGQI